MTKFVIKVMVLSAGVSIAIKYAAPVLAIPPRSLNAAIAVCLPSLIMALLLGWRWQRHQTGKHSKLSQEG